MTEFRFTEVVRVTQVPLNEEIANTQSYTPDTPSNIEDLLAFMSSLSLQDQVFLLCNSLTISGYTQKEISEAMGVPYQTYRNRILNIRKNFRGRKVDSL